MRGMVIDSYGKELSLRMAELPDPEMRPDHVRVAVKAAAVNPADYKVATGEAKILHARKFPMVLGYDFAGVVLEGGEGIGLKKGDRVYGHLPYSGSNQQGTFCEQVVVPDGSLARMSASGSFETYACAATVGLTAMLAYRKLGSLSGKKIFIHGASGGVGSLAVQIAKLQGAQVTAVCSGTSAAYVKSLGADTVIDYTQTPVRSLTGEYDLLFDVASNLSFFSVRHLIVPGGRFIALLPSPSLIAGIFAGPLLGKKCGFVIVKSVRSELETLASWIEQGRVKPAIDATFPLERIGDALRKAQAGRLKGKVAISL